jgi:hypothetical protein
MALLRGRAGRRQPEHEGGGVGGCRMGVRAGGGGSGWRAVRAAGGGGKIRVEITHSSK